MKTGKKRVLFNILQSLQGAPVRNETERVGPDPVEELDKGEGEVEEEEAQQVPRVGVGQDEPDPVALHCRN